jgi:hypothetical protein
VDFLRRSVSVDGIVLNDVALAGWESQSWWIPNVRGSLVLDLRPGEWAVVQEWALLTQA